MKKFKIYLRGLEPVKPYGSKIKIVKDDIEAFNLSHALSHCLNLAKEQKINVKELNISEIYA